MKNIYLIWKKIIPKQKTPPQYIGSNPKSSSDLNSMQCIKVPVFPNFLHNFKLEYLKYETHAKAREGDLKFVNLQYNTLVPWFAETNEWSTKRPKVQALFVW